MITRAQAEALLTLAESLEACERLGIKFRARRDSIDLQCLDGFEGHILYELTSIELRIAVDQLMPERKD